MERKVALQIRNNEPLELMVDLMVKSGFKYVSMSFGDEKPLLKEDWKDYITYIDQLFKKNGLKCVMTHAPYYHLLVSAEVRDQDMETAMLRTIEATKMLGAEICAVHPRSVLIYAEDRDNTVDRARSLQENVISFTPLVKECEKVGVKLGVENLMRYPFKYPPFYSYMAEDHVELIEKLNSDSVCAVWDFGHANLCDEDQAQRIKKLGSRIMGTHIHNNDGEDDCHYPPFIPDKSGYFVRRSVDWDSVMTALKETGFDGYLTLEPTFHFDYSIDSLVKYLYDSVCALDSIMKK